jgi:ABC-type dipeptide/oligopeptide/nickel transport system ATPase component
MPEQAPTHPLLAVRDLAVSFDAHGRTVRAVDGVSMTIHPGQTLGVVGESGCGKSVTAMSLMHLIPRPPGRFERGAAVFQTSDGPRDLLAMSEHDIRAIRGGQIAMIFQEPMSSLNPVFSVGDQIVEAIRLHQRLGHRAARDLAVRSLADVGIANPAARLADYPHQFSGGMRQRVMIAMALACRPKLLLADEPTTALDATVQKQILSLLAGLRRSLGMAIMLITHDLGVVAEQADVVCVMFAGRVVEYGRTAEVLARPMHPYTRALLACIPRLDSKRERLWTVSDLLAQPDFLSIADGRFATGDSNPKPWWPSQPNSNALPNYRLCHITEGRWVAVSAAPASDDPPPDVAPQAPSPVAADSPR